MSRHGKATKKQLEQKLRQRQKRRERLAAGWSEVVREAQRLISRDQWNEARDVLEAFDRSHPPEPQIFRLLLDVYHEQGEYGDYCRTCRRLLERDPDDRPVRLMLAGGYLAEGRPVLALLAFRRYVERWPDDPMIEGVEDTILKLEAAVKEILKDVPFAADEKLELAAMHEEMLASLAWGDNARVIQLGEKLLDRSPEFVSAMNNMSQAYAMSGRTSDAIAMSRRALELDDQNFHALANLARLLLLAGFDEEATEACQRLRAVESDNSEIWCKKAETFSFFGDDPAVLEVLAQAKRKGLMSQRSPDVALLFHLAGVAAARLGNWRPAREHWRQALKIRPGFELAEQNLSDSEKPAGQRQGPWAYGIEYWIPRAAIEQLAAAIDPPAARRDEPSRTAAARRYVDEHSAWSKLVPLLLDRGDEDGRRLAWQLAFLLDTPPMHEALRAFCLSQRGPDELRITTANRLSQTSLLPPGRVRMWIEGEWRELELMGFEITEEPMGERHSPQVEEWDLEGMEAVQRGDGQTAERLFKKCLELEPDRPDLLNNLCAAYELLDRNDESDALIRQIHERWPDYFFGRSNMAVIAARDGRYDEAEALLNPLRQQKRLHITEFTALCLAYIQLFIAQRKFDAARSWLGMFKQLAPDHPAVARFERTLMLAEPLDWLSGLFGRRK